MLRISKVYNSFILVNKLFSDILYIGCECLCCPDQYAATCSDLDAAVSEQFLFTLVKKELRLAVAVVTGTVKYIFNIGSGPL